MSIKKNFIYNIAYQILLIILPLVTAPYVSRVLGANGVGLYSYYNSVVKYFSLFIMLGVNNYGNRSIAIVKNDKNKLASTFWGIYSLQFFMSIIIVIMYIIYCYFVVGDNKIIAIIQIITILSYMLDINWFYFGMEEFKLTVSRNFVIKISTFIFVLIFVKNRSDLNKYVLIMSLGTCLGNLYLWIKLRKYVNFIRISIKDIIIHIKPNISLFIPVIAVSLYRIMDKIMLGIFSTTEQVGFYENSEKIINMPLGLITALGTVMLPRVSNIISKDINLVKNYISKSLEFSMFMAFAITFGLIAVANNFSVIFFGNEFLECGKIITFLSPTVILVAWANVIRTQYLLPNKNDKFYTISVCLGAVINVLLNLIFIPKLGAVGAAIGTLFTELSVAIYQTWCVRRQLEIKKYIKNTLKFMLSGIVMYISIINIGKIIENNIERMLIQVISGVLVYACFVILCYMFESKIKNKVANDRVKPSR